ncbi:hypothetical protein ACHAW6_012013 [Cyclotella cf. meneghiniana]
MSTRPFC